MFLKIKDVLSKNISKTITKIILVLLIPVLMVSFFSLLLNSYHMSNYKSLLISNYSNELNSFLKDTEEKMMLLIRSSQFIAENPNINYILNTTQAPDSNATTSCIKSLDQASDLSNIIDSVAIYNKAANFVISTTGLYDSDTYFNSIYPYQNYSLSYWANFHTSQSATKILAPTNIINNYTSESLSIVPLVFQPYGRSSHSSIIIFNININTLFANFEIYKLTKNTKVYMTDNNTGNIYSSGNFAQPITDFSYNSLQFVDQSPQTISKAVSIDGHKYLMIQSNKRSNVWGYIYFVTVPYSDINNEASSILLMSCLILLGLFILLVMFTFWGSKALYKPWVKLSHTVKSINPMTDTENSVAQIEDYVTSVFFDLKERNLSLNKNLQVTLPLSQEKYLIDILNENITEDASEDILHSLSFKYDYFSAVSINCAINPDFLVEENLSLSSLVLQKKVYKVISDIFAESFITYEFSGSNHILYLLLNVENDLLMDEILKTLEYIKTVIKYDEKNLDITFGIGNIYKGIDGLKLTHQESITSISKSLSSRSIQFSVSKNTGYVFSINSENILVNYISAGLTDKSKDFLNNIFDEIASESLINRRQIYSDIMHTFKKAIQQKNIHSTASSLSTLNELIKTERNLPDAEIKSLLFELVDLISEYMHFDSKKVDIAEIIEYLNDHYSDNIFLDELAEKYNTTSKYLSKRIKQHLGIPFKDYMMQLKIDKAKELLTTTDTPISEIFSIVGFQNRSAFFRAFKLKTDMSPSEYKKAYTLNKR